MNIYKLKDVLRLAETAPEYRDGVQWAVNAIAALRNEIEKVEADFVRQSGVNDAPRDLSTQVRRKPMSADLIAEGFNMRFGTPERAKWNEEAKWEFLYELEDKLSLFLPSSGRAPARMALAVFRDLFRGEVK